MDNTTYISLSRQAALWNQLEVVSNNLANVNTIGFKGSDVLFSEVLVKSRTDERPFQDKVAFVHDFGLVRNLAQGPLRHTNNPLDLSLEGDGYFVLRNDEGEVYSRAGNFTIDEQGVLVNQEGLPVLSTTNSEVTFEPGTQEILINGDGVVSTENGEIAQIRVVTFDDPRELKQVSGTLFRSEGMPAIDLDSPRVAQGTLEDSNVNGVQEMTRLIALNRAYQDVHKMIESEAQRKKEAISVFTRQVSA